MLAEEWMMHNNAGRQIRAEDAQQAEDQASTASAPAAHDAPCDVSDNASHFASPDPRVTDFPRRRPHADRNAAEQDRKSKPMWKWTALLAIAVVVAWYATRDAGSPPAAVAGASVAPLELAAMDVAVVEPRVLTRLLPLSGSIAPFVQALVKSKVSGEVEQVTVREGQNVEAGQIIARIDARNLQAQYDRELAAVEKARADLELAQLNRDKNRTLLEQKFISRNTFEQTESAYAASLASYKLAQAQARVAQINLEDALVRAPFSGTIARRMVHPGENASTDSPIVSIVDLRQMVLEAALPAADIPSVRIGQKARFTVSGFGARQFEGEVQRINPVTTDGSRAIAVYIAVPNEDGALKGGMFAQGELVLDATQPVLAVAQRAVREEAGGKYVYILRDGQIVRTSVTLGSSIDGASYVEVRGGLSAGDRVILVEIGDDKVGMRAVVRDPTAPATPFTPTPAADT